jgi:hypothetical protein
MNDARPAAADPTDARRFPVLTIVACAKLLPTRVATRASGAR